MRLFSRSLMAGVAAFVAIPAMAADLAIGVPIAQTGVYAFVGVPGMRGMQIAADQANASGDLGDNKIKLIVEDDASERAQTITLANRMIVRDNVLMFVGAAGTPPALALAAIAKDKEIPFMAMATSPAITQVSPWSYHVMSPPAVQMGAVLQYALERFKPKTAGTIWTRDNEGATAQGKFAREQLAAKGVTLIPEETVLNSESDFAAVVTKLTAAQPDILVVTMSENNSANLIAQARLAGLKSQIIASTTVVGEGFVRTGGAAVEGTVAPADYFPGRSDPLNDAFIAEYQKRHNEAPDNWAALGYAAMKVSIEAIKKAGDNPTRAAIREAMQNSKDIPVVLGDGKFSFDKDREPSYPPAIVELKDGKFVLATR